MLRTAARPALDGRRRDVERPDAGPATNGRWLHPDQHALVTVPGEPLQFIAGNDGGVVRSNGNYVDASAQVRHARAERRPTPRSASRCSTGSRIRPTTLNKGLSTLQFQSLSVEPDASAEQPAGRHAGQRHVRVQRARRRSGRRSSTATAASPAGTPPTARCGSTRSSGRRTTRTSGTAIRRSGSIISGTIAGSPEGSQLLPADHRRSEPGDGRLDLPGLAERLADPGLGRRS